MDPNALLNRTLKFDRLSNLDPTENRASKRASNRGVYLALIKDLIKELNEAKGNPKEKAIVLHQLKHVDKLYLNAQGIEITRQVLFMRHAECSALGDKALGLEPNTPANDAALAAMKDTHQYTASLLVNQKVPPTVVISPLVRTLQTAVKVVPRDVKANIFIDPALSENGGMPSSTDARGHAQLTKEMNEAPLFSKKKVLSVKVPVPSVKKAMLWVSTKRETNFYDLQTKRDEAIDSLREIGEGGTGIGSEAKHSQFYRNTKLTNEEKKEAINNWIQTKGTVDLILIGHGSNFKSFFNDTFENESSFGYCETRSVYVVQDSSDDKPKLYSPSYSLSINQKTGEIEGTYTKNTALRELKKIEEQKDSHQVVLGMLSDDQQQQSQPQPTSALNHGQPQPTSALNHGQPQPSSALNPGAQYEDMDYDQGENYDQNDGSPSDGSPYELYEIDGYLYTRDQMEWQNKSTDSQTELGDQSNHSSTASTAPQRFFPQPEKKTDMVLPTDNDNDETAQATNQS